MSIASGKVGTTTLLPVDQLRTTPLMYSTLPLRRQMTPQVVTALPDSSAQPSPQAKRTHYRSKTDYSTQSTGPITN